MYRSANPGDRQLIITMRAMSEVVLDPAAAYPELKPLREALKRGDWPAARSILDSCDTARRTAFLSYESAVDGLEEVLRAALRADPGDAAASAALGSHLTLAAWKIRGNARASSTSEEQFAGFHEVLLQAEEALIEGAARNPRDPAIWAARLVTGRGLSVGQAEARRRYDRVAAVDPHNMTAQQS